MDWLTILNALFSVLGTASGGFLAYGAWLCLRLNLSGRRARRESKKTQDDAKWPHAMHVG